jgi:hypothetical protein
LHGALTTDHDYNPDLARAYTRDLTHALEVARNLARTYNLDRIPTRTPTDNLGVLRTVRQRAPGSDDPSRPARTPPVRQRPRVGIGPLPRRLLAAAAFLLPAADRTRFTEEYLSELWEIAHAGIGPRGQTLYAIRQALRVIRLRGTLLAPRRRKASP